MMQFRTCMFTLPIALLGVAAGSVMAHADTLTGKLKNDASVYSYSFSTTMAETYTFATTSYATGGFLPALTLFNATTGVNLASTDGAPVGSNGMDATLSATLGPGSYLLDLSEFPNESLGNLADGFLLSQYADGKTYTGDSCGVSGGMFYNTITCQKTTDKYSLNVATASPVPEPATWALMLSGAAGLVLLLGKRNLA